MLIAEGGVYLLPPSIPPLDRGKKVSMNRALLVTIDRSHPVEILCIFSPSMGRQFIEKAGAQLGRMKRPFVSRRSEVR
jgi:hypothetical protein